MTEYIQVVTTVEHQADARRIADLLVQSRLAGCVQIVGSVTSVYRWQGKVETATETMLCIKSRRDLYPELEQVILANHPYEVPEILAFPVTTGSPGYFAWLAGELRG